MQSNQIYFDNHATTPLDPEVLKEMLPFFTNEFGNASSKHSLGWSAEKAVEKARLQVAELISAQSKEIIFTSGATESNNLALLGIAESYREKGKHIIVSSIEHKSVLDCCIELESRGFKITRLPVNSEGLISVEDLKNSLTSETILVSIQLANNEIGTIQPLREFSKILREKNIFFHTDAVQGAGFLKINVNDLGVDLLSLSAHKIYGPKGIGALYIRSQSPRIKVKPLIFGGGHERGMRSGTLNVPAIVGFGKAAELASTLRSQDFERVKALRDQLENNLRENLDGNGVGKIRVNGHPVSRLPNNLNICFEDIGKSIDIGNSSGIGNRDTVDDINDLLKKIPQLAVSTGAACTTAPIEPSHVLQAIGLPEELIHKTLRFGLGRMTTSHQVEEASRLILNALKN